MTRDDVFFNVIKHLNSIGAQGTSVYYDCGELGVCHVWWDGSWKVEWVVLEELPFRVGD